MFIYCIHSWKEGVRMVYDIYVLCSFMEGEVRNDIHMICFYTFVEGGGVNGVCAYKERYRLLSFRKDSRPNLSHSKQPYDI